MLHILSTLISATALFSFIASAQAATGTQFDDLRDRLLAGTPTVSISHLDKCGHPAGEKLPAAMPIGGLTIRDFMILPGPKPAIAYADRHLTVMPDGTPVLELVQYRITPNDMATVTARRLSPTTYKQLSDPMVFECPLGTGQQFMPETGVIPATGGPGK
ncbi:hypothetical protein C5748_20115 [Phyllobacterium phragmitis]|uniref:VirK protein n=1 Tax=Phyllobacterium phragmitis TaxID=2670329 RepID=A0A2S9IML1_9HYPH|nr:VirK family protein [Phyllobacterium phragmitis]PRD41766.1 hypothetical protein C5748_20115 [Phyllobacterium phragmitis]